MLSLPLLAWIASSVAMMLVTMNAGPNGLAGNYTINAHNSVDVPLGSARITPNELLRRLASEHGLRRVYSVRLQPRGNELWYTVKPTPSALAMTFDAMTGARLDPLSDERLALVAGEALAGSRFVRLEEAPEYNRYYDVSRVPAVRATVDGDQAATLVLSRDEGRTLRRMNAGSGRFEWWYRTLHVNQLSDHLMVWTTILLTCATGVIVLVFLGYQLFWWRRTRATVTGGSDGLGARTLHRRAGLVVGGLLALEMGAGIYMWICFGPMEDPFRGKASINRAWAAGIPTTHGLAEPGTVLQATGASDAPGSRPVQAIEWRRLGDRDTWIVVRNLSELGDVHDAATGERTERIPVELAGLVARQETVGEPVYFYVGESSQLWMDLNTQVSAYRFRFEDPDRSDVYVAMANGQVLQRRSAFWRRFGPYLDLHMFAITGRGGIDMVLLGLFELGVIVSVLTGMFLQFAPLKRDPNRA
ncbi:MAG: hypothetical protein IT361_03000 [Gemmatimonadaceae bacterium]|nr:hypothetical protein [Gemmatimonadaceae bacterium]